MSFLMNKDGLVNAGVIVGVGLALLLIAGGVLFRFRTPESDSAEVPYEEQVVAEEAEGQYSVADMRGAVNDINHSAPDTDDCAASKFRMPVPGGWGCRKLDDNAQDVTLYTDDNTLTFTVGVNQDTSACGVLMNCDTLSYELSGFDGVTKSIVPGANAVEITGYLVVDPIVRVLIQSDDELTADEETIIRQMAGSIIVN